MSPFVKVTQAGRLFAIMSARVQAESEVLAGLQEVIHPPHKDVDTAYSLVWRENYYWSLCFIVTDEFLSDESQMRRLHAHTYFIYEGSDMDICIYTHI